MYALIVTVQDALGDVSTFKEAEFSSESDARFSGSWLLGAGYGRASHRVIRYAVYDAQHNMLTEEVW